MIRVVAVIFQRLYQCGVFSCRCFGFAANEYDVTNCSIIATAKGMKKIIFWLIAFELWNIFNPLIACRLWDKLVLVQTMKFADFFCVTISFILTVDAVESIYWNWELLYKHIICSHSFYFITIWSHVFIFHLQQLCKWWLRCNVFCV